MKCPRCNVEMVKGQAIDGFSGRPVRSIAAFQAVVDHKTLKLVECLKCPKCGHSDDGVDPTRLFGIVDNR